MDSSEQTKALGQAPLSNSSSHKCEAELKEQAAASAPTADAEQSTLMYLRRLGYRPLFSRFVETQLVERAQQGDSDAASRLIDVHLRLVVSIARTYLTPGVRLVDLVHAGKSGFSYALESYTEARGLRFLAYATSQIRQAIELKREEAERLNAGSAGAIDEPEAPAYASDDDTYFVALDSFFKNVFDEPLSKSLGHSWRDKSHEQLVRWLAQLPTQHQRFLAERFGLDDQQMHSMQEISSNSGLSIGKLREIQLEALSRLKKIVRSP